MATFALPETTGPIDTHGHTVADSPADHQITLRDGEADPAEAGQTDSNDLFLAQTPAEVQAQIDNVPGEEA